MYPSDTTANRNRTFGLIPKESGLTPRRNFHLLEDCCNRERVNKNRKEPLVHLTHVSSKLEKKCDVSETFRCLIVRGVEYVLSVALTR